MNIPEQIKERLSDLTMYFHDLSNTATIELIKEGNKVIGYIAYQVKTYEQLEKILEENDEEEFILPDFSTFIYLEAIEILKPYQDQGYGKKAFLEFQEKCTDPIIFQFTGESEYFWNKFNFDLVEGATWWMYILTREAVIA